MRIYSISPERQHPTTQEDFSGSPNTNQSSKDNRQGGTGTICSVPDWFGLQDMYDAEKFPGNLDDLTPEQQKRIETYKLKVKTFPATISQNSAGIDPLSARVRREIYYKFATEPIYEFTKWFEKDLPAASKVRSAPLREGSSNNIIVGLDCPCSSWIKVSTKEEPSPEKRSFLDRFLTKEQRSEFTISAARTIASGLSCALDSNICSDDGDNSEDQGGFVFAFPSQI